MCDVMCVREVCGGYDIKVSRTLCYNHNNRWSGVLYIGKDGKYQRSTKIHSKYKMIIIIIMGIPLV